QVSIWAGYSVVKVLCRAWNRVPSPSLPGAFGPILQAIHLHHIKKAACKRSFTHRRLFKLQSSGFFFLNRSFLDLSLISLPCAAVIDTARNTNSMDSLFPAHTANGFLDHVTDRLIRNTQVRSDVLRPFSFDEIKPHHTLLFFCHKVQILFHLFYLLPFNQACQAIPSEITDITAILRIQVVQGNL